MSERPVGPVVDATPALRPGAAVLEGRTCTVEGLDARRHGPALWRAVRDDATLWDYLAYGPFASEADFMGWLEERAVLLDPFSYVVTSQRAAAGLLTLMEIRPAMRVVEIGNIVYSPALQRHTAATEAQYLVARHVFEVLGYRRYEWKCNALNAPSIRAAGRLGFRYEGSFRQHMIVKGRNRDTAWFAMTDAEWPERKRAFEAWLAPGNFDAGGRQVRSLSAINAAIAGQNTVGRTA